MDTAMFFSKRHVKPYALDGFVEKVIGNMQDFGVHVGIDNAIGDSCNNKQQGTSTSTMSMI